MKGKITGCVTGNWTVCVLWVGVCGHTLGRYTGKRVAKPLLVFWGQECLPFRFNGVQVQGTPGPWGWGTGVPSTGPQGTGESCGEMGLEVGSHPKKLK